jgi:hypothetical protein
MSALVLLRGVMVKSLVAGLVRTRSEIAEGDGWFVAAGDGPDLLLQDENDKVSKIADTAPAIAKKVR